MAEESKKYNGWTNYETWAINLWLSNDQATDTHIREMVRYCIRRADRHPNVPKIWTEKEAATFTLADALKEFIEAENPLKDTATLFSDLISAAISEVNWTELAEHYVEDESEYFQEGADEDEDEE